jgi:hypothetical protein
MRLLTRQGFLVEEQGMTYLAEADRESSLLPLQVSANITLMTNWTNAPFAHPIIKPVLLFATGSAFPLS